MNDDEKHDDKLEIIEERISLVRNKCSSFKIGKTGDELTITFNDRYKDEYKDIVSVYLSPSKKFIRDLESYFITKFIDDSKNNNINEGSGGEMKSETGIYKLYVVYDF